MENKKSSKADLQQWRATFFNVGMSVSLCTVILAFSYRQSAPDVKEMAFDGDAFEDIIIPPTVQEPPPPPPKPKLVMPEIKPVPDEEVIEEPPSFTFEPTKEELGVYTEWGDYDNEPTPEAPFEVVEHPATFVGGDKALYQYLSDNMKYPTLARRSQIQGRVYVKFIVNTDGSISDAHVVKGIGFGCDEEALEAIKKMPDWNPPRQRGRAVRQWIMVPVVFKLQ